MAQDSELEAIRQKYETKAITRDGFNVESEVENASNWMTTISFAVLAFFLAQIIQIKLRIGLDSSIKSDVFFALLGMSISAGIGLLLKIFAILKGFLIASQQNETSQNITSTILLPKNFQNKEETEFENMFPGLLSGKKLAVFRLFLLPILQGAFLYGGIINAVTFMLIFLLDLEPNTAALIETTLLQLMPFLFYVFLFERNLLTRISKNMKLAGKLFKLQIQKNMSEPKD